jgi:two-component system NarL family sensor kinase
LILPSEPEVARHGATYPLLAESDLHGQLLWTNSRARSALGEEAGSLLRLQTRFVDHYFRLQRAARNLSNLAQASRPAAATSAVRQVELERERLGRDLHTGVGQLLVAIRLQLEVIATQMPDPPERVRQALQRIDTLSNDAGEQVRSLSRHLHPPEWQRLTLEAAVQQMWENSGVPERFQTSLHIEPLPREPEQEIKVLVYRAVQEALTNLVRHSQASRVEMVLEPQGDRVALNIHDNGVGFDVPGLLSTPANVRQGIGLRSIREQAASLGGNLEIHSGPEGTRLELSVPLVLPHS